MLSARRITVALVVAVTLAAVAARVVPAFDEPLWLDEVVSARIITAPSPGASVTRVRKTESSPPGWHLVNWVAWRAAGSPARLERLRLLSVLFGGLLAALVVLHALALGLTRLGAAVAGGIAALGPNVVAHGAELRPYALLTLLALAFAMSLERAARAPKRAWLVALALVVLAGCYTHYFFLFTLATGGAWAAARLRGRARVRVLAALAAGTLPFAVWLPSFRFQYRHDLYAYNGPFNLHAVAYSYARIVGILGQTGAFAALVRLLFAAVVIGGVVLLFRSRETELTGLLAVVPLGAAALAWAFGPHVFNERNLLVCLPFAAIAIGRLVSVPRRGLDAVLLAGLAAAVGYSLWQFEVDYGRSAYDRIAATLVDDGWHPGDEIAQFGPAPLGLSEPVGWYLPGHPMLARARPGACGTLLAVSYDAGPGLRWIRAHRTGPLRLFAAYDHTPRGPRASTPIGVGRVEASAQAAAAHGARLLRVGGQRRCT